MKILTHKLTCILLLLVLSFVAGHSSAADTLNILDSNQGIAIPSTGSISIGGDTFLVRDAANVLAQRNGVSAQSFKLYNTYTDASNYERASLSWSSNVFNLITEAAGTGILRGISIVAPTGNTLTLGGGSISTLMVGSTYIRPGVNGNTALGQASFGYSKLYVDYTNTGTVGAVTINKASGRVNLAAAGTSLVITNSTVTAAAHCFVNPDGSPGNAVAVLFYAVPAAGTLTINAVPAVTNQTAIDFFCVNAD